MEVAQIIPSYLRGRPLLTLLGRPGMSEDTYDIIWNEKNGLPMIADGEVAFRKGRIAIVPIEDSTLRFKMVVLDPTLFSEELSELNRRYAAVGRKTWKDLDGKELVFQHATNRPGKRNLFFHYCMAVLRQERQQPSGWADNIAIFKEADAERGVWATPGKWFNRSTLQHLLLAVGNLDPNGTVGRETKTWVENHCFDRPLTVPEPFDADEDDADMLDPVAFDKRMAESLWDSIMRTEDQDS